MLSGLTLNIFLFLQKNRGAVYWKVKTITWFLLSYQQVTNLCHLFFTWQLQVTSEISLTWGGERDRCQGKQYNKGVFLDYKVSQSSYRVIFLTKTFVCNLISPEKLWEVEWKFLRNVRKRITYMVDMRVSTLVHKRSTLVIPETNKS